MTAPSASPPTARVLDVLELLSARADQRVRLLDLERELHLTKATAHAILTTLCDRHWVRRDPKDKSFSLGPALSKVAATAPSASRYEQAALDAAVELARETGYNASVVELIGDTQSVIVFDPSGQQLTLPGSTDRVDFAAPFGAIFAAYDPGLARVWIERSGTTNAELIGRLESLLAIIRERGLTVERMSAVMVRAAELGHQLRQGAGTEPMRRAMDALLDEVATAGYLHEVTGKGGDQPVTSLAAPVFDPDGRVTVGVGLHPFTRLSPAKLERLGQRVRRAASDAATAAGSDDGRVPAAAAGRG